MTRSHLYKDMVNWIEHSGIGNCTCKAFGWETNLGGLSDKESICKGSQYVKR